MRFYELHFKSSLDGQNEEIKRLNNLRKLKKNTYRCMFTPEWIYNKDNEKLDLMMHAPCLSEIDVPDRAHFVSLGFGLLESSFTHDDAKTDGAEFRILLHYPGEDNRVIWTKTLYPFQKMDDRGEKKVKIELPAYHDRRITIETLTGQKNDPTYDHTFISELSFSE